MNDSPSVAVHVAQIHSEGGPLEQLQLQEILHMQSPLADQIYQLK